MIEFVAFPLGMGMSFIGTLPPGVISMTVMDTAARKSLRDALIVAGAAAFVEFFQAIAAVLFGSYITKSTFISSVIHYSSAPLFLFIGIYILFSRHRPVSTHKHTGAATNIAKGIIVSAGNLLVIPFWILWSSYFAANGWIDYALSSVLLFSAGVTGGTFLALSLYAKLGLRIAARSERVAHWGRKVVGVVFLLFGAYQLLNYFIESSA